MKSHIRNEKRLKQKAIASTASVYKVANEITKKMHGLSTYYPKAFLARKRIKLFEAERAKS